MRLAALLCALLLPVQAAALSCLKPSVGRTFAQANAAEATYVVVEGRLTLDDRRVPKSLEGGAEPPKLTEVPAHLTGRSLSVAGFRTPFERDITLEISCLGPWCGSVANGTEVLAFLRHGKAGYVLEVEPCGGYVFDNLPEQRRRVRDCLRGDACPE